MGLINNPIANLFNGVSQQPAQLRLGSQCEASENFYPTIATGLGKRMPTEFLAKLSSSGDRSAYATVINRDTTERYVLLITNGSLEVYDAFTGASKTVNFPSGSSYLGSPSPRSDFSTVTIADYTFVVNKGVTVQMSTATAPVNDNVGYVSFTYNGAGVSRTMSILVDGVTKATYSGADTSISTAINSILTQLQANMGADYIVTKPYTNLIKIKRTSATVFNLAATDDYGDSTMKIIKGSVQVFSDLPQHVDDGYICYITSVPGQDGKGYYVRYSAADNSYVECPKPGVQTTLNAATMPHKLVREANGTFTFAPLAWNTRTVGDDGSIPLPSFVGRKINDVFFYRNRLGMLSDENTILSTAGDYYNFFAKTATAVLDSDPIDQAVANTKVSILRHAVPFNKVLLLFSDQTQFQLSSGDILVLTPKSIKVDPVTEFTSSAKCRPVGAGHELFFVVERDGFAGVREYFVDQNTLSNDAADTTAHVPAYIPSGVFKLAVSTSEDCLFALTESDPNAIYVYKYFWGKEEKVQSAWVRFKLDPEDIIMGCEFIGPTAYLIIGRNDGVYLEQVNLQALKRDPGLSFCVLLDRKVPLNGTYNATTNTTSWALPWPYSGQVYGVAGSAFGTQAGSVLELDRASTYTATTAGNWTAGQVYVGVGYTARFRFSEQFIKDQNNIAIASAKVKMRRMLMSYVESGYFRAEVTPPGRDTASHVFTGKTLGATPIGAVPISTGPFRFPIMADSHGVVIELLNDSPLPSTFQNAEWEGEVVVRASRK